MAGDDPAGLTAGDVVKGHVANPLAWSHLTPQLSRAKVTQLGGTVAPIDGAGDFWLHAQPGEYAVCYGRNGIGGRVAGC